MFFCVCLHRHPFVHRHHPITTNLVAQSPCTHLQPIPCRHHTPMSPPHPHVATTRPSPHDHHHTPITTRPSSHDQIPQQSITYVLPFCGYISQRFVIQWFMSYTCNPTWVTPHIFAAFLIWISIILTTFQRTKCSTSQGEHQEPPNPHHAPTPTMRQKYKEKHPVLPSFVPRPDRPHPPHPSSGHFSKKSPNLTLEHNIEQEGHIKEYTPQFCIKMYA